MLTSMLLGLFGLLSAAGKAIVPASELGLYGLLSAAGKASLAA